MILLIGRLLKSVIFFHGYLLFLLPVFVFTLSDNKRFIPMSLLPVADNGRICWKFPKYLCSISTRQLEILLWRAGPTAQYMQDCPIFFIQLNYVHNNQRNKVLLPHAKLPATRWHWGFHFLLINEAVQGKHWEEDVGLLVLLSRAIVPTV